MSQQVDLDAVPQPVEDVLSTTSQGGSVLMSMDTGKFVELNDTARAIWDLTDGKASVAAVIAQLGEQFDVEPAQCRDEVLAAYARFRDENLVRFEG